MGSISVEGINTEAMFKNFFNELYQTFPQSGGNRDFKTKLQVYMKTLKPVFNNFSQDIYDEIQREVLLNYDWFPKVIDLSRLGARYCNRYLAEANISAKRKRELLDPKKWKVDVNTYKELNKEQAQKAFLHVMKEFRLDDQACEQFYNDVYLLFQGFLIEDMYFLRDELRSKKRAFDAKAVLDIICKIRRDYIIPRWEEIVDLNLGFDQYWTKEPSPEKKKEYVTMQRKIRSLDLPSLKKKDKEKTN